MKKICSILTMLAVMITLTASVVSASTVVPSIDQKQAPSLSEQAAPDGTKYIAKLVDSSGNAKEFYGTQYITLTPIVDSSEIPNQDDRVKLENLYQRVVAASDLSEISPELTTAVSDFTALYPNRVPKLDVKDLVVLDLFDLSASDDIVGLISEENPLVVYFDLGVAEDEPVFIIHNHEGDECEVITTEYVGDGVVAATFTSFSPVAVVVEKSSNALDVPKTGDNQNILIFVITGIAAVAAVSLLLLKRVTKK